MNVQRRVTIATLLSLAVLVTAGVAASLADPVPTCGEHVDGTGPDATVTFTPCPDDPTATLVPDGPQVVKPMPGMTNVRARPFDTATVADDDRTVTIDFWSGIEPCAVLDHVQVDFGDDAVTITLFEGSDPAAGDVACIEIAVEKRVVLVLEELLAGREIVDGGGDA